MPPGAVSLDDVDLDQVSVDYILGCSKKGDETCFICLWNAIYFAWIHPLITLIIIGAMVELSEAIREYHDSTEFPNMVGRSLFCCNFYIFFVLI